MRSPSSAGLVLIPGISLVPILVGIQVINAVLLLLLLAYMSGIARDRKLMGKYAAGRAVSSIPAVAGGGGQRFVCD